MGKQVVFTDIEWEFMQQKIEAGLINLAFASNPLSPSQTPSPAFPASIEEETQDNLGACILARLENADTVPDPGPPTVISPGAPSPTGPEMMPTSAQTQPSAPPAGPAYY